MSDYTTGWRDAILHCIDSTNAIRMTKSLSYSALFIQ